MIKMPCYTKRTYKEAVVEEANYRGRNGAKWVEGGSSELWLLGNQRGRIAW